MNNTSSVLSTPKNLFASPAPIQSQEDPLLTIDETDEHASTLLGFKKKVEAHASIFHHPEIKLRYTNQEMLKIFKTLGRFESPLNTLFTFRIDERNSDTLSEIMGSKPNVVLELLKDELLSASKSRPVHQNSAKRETLRNNVLVDIETEIQRMKAARI